MSVFWALGARLAAPFAVPCSDMGFLSRKPPDPAQRPSLAAAQRGFFVRDSSAGVYGDVRGRLRSRICPPDVPRERPRRSFGTPRERPSVNVRGCFAEMGV